MESKSKIWLIGIFLAVVFLRLLFAFQTQGLDYDAYSVLRQVEHIHNTGLPILNDELSYSGRVHIFSPLYHYFLASFTFILPLELVAKIIPNILAATIILIVFLFAMHISKDENIALLSAAISGIIPIFFTRTLNNASIYTMIIPVFLLTAYFFVLTVKDIKHIWKLLIAMIFLTFLHPISLILMFSLLIYILLINIENLRKSYREIELVFFFFFFVFWANIIIYKRALLAHGQAVLFQNIPTYIITDSFKSITFLESIYNIGLIPIIFGLIAIYAALFISNSKTLMFVTSIILSTFILLWFKLIMLDAGLILLSFSLLIVSSYAIGRLYERSKMIKLKNMHNYLILALFIVSAGIFVIGIILSSNNAISEKDVEAMKWLKDNSEQNAVVFALPEEGSAVSYFSNRKNVIDDDYVMISNINTRYEDVKQLYKDIFLTTALERLNYYSADYILLSEYAQNKNNISEIPFYDGSCIEQVYSKRTKERTKNKGLEQNIAKIQNQNINITPKIYKVNCKLLSSETGEITG